MLSDTMVAVAAAVTAVVAIKGLKTWQQELHGRAEFDAARNLIRGTYKLRDALTVCRSPLVHAHEFPAGYGGALATHSRDEEAAAWTHVYRNRWEPLIEVFQDFEAHALEAEAIWGAAVAARVEEVRKCVRELKSGMEAVISDKGAGGDDFRLNPPFGQEMRALVSATGKENELTVAIQSAVAGMEAELRPHLKRH